MRAWVQEFRWGQGRAQKWGGGGGAHCGGRCARGEQARARARSREYESRPLSSRPRARALSTARRAAYHPATHRGKGRTQHSNKQCGQSMGGGRALSGGEGGAASLKLLPVGGCLLQNHGFNVYPN